MNVELTINVIHKGASMLLRSPRILYPTNRRPAESLDKQAWSRVLANLPNPASVKRTTTYSILLCGRMPTVMNESSNEIPMQRRLQRLHSLGYNSCCTLKINRSMRPACSHCSAASLRFFAELILGICPFCIHKALNAMARMLLKVEV